MMNKMERQAFADRINGMSDEEKKFALRFMPSEFLSEELERRCVTAGNMLYDIDNIIGNMSTNPSLEEMQAAVAKIKHTLN